LGNSLVEASSLDLARELLNKAGGKIVLPTDGVLGDKFDAAANKQTVDLSVGVPDGWAMYDIGPDTIAAFAKVLSTAKTVVWNGPMGVFELEPFAVGTFAIAEALADITKTGAITIVGGGDSAAAIEQAGLADKITHLSTGGGASLEMLEGKTLPGVAALKDK
ncbi:MAG TPA: phosphoglycerate kinase, partial [Candidatus Limnocylindrales bacterium]|nr:phosphoglycerate kinase [Candidatus Limnocylindrales bacterium]